MLLAAVLIAGMRRRRHDEPVPAGAVAAPPEEPKPVWTPWRRSPMTGPSWNEAPPPTREGSWADSPAKETEPEPEPQHEPWTAPRPKRPVR